MEKFRPWSPASEWLKKDMCTLVMVIYMYAPHMQTFDKFK